MDAIHAELIRDFIRARFPDIQITVDDDIFSLGFINSLFAMELVMFIERTFDIKLPNDELKFSNFRTVRSMTELVARQVEPIALGLDAQ
jgi:methoxymalonate biosynthesis acyl carrier protein